MERNQLRNSLTHSFTHSANTDQAPALLEARPGACGGQTTGVPLRLCPGLDGDCPLTWPWVPGGGSPKKASFEEETNTPYHRTAATQAVSTSGCGGTSGPDRAQGLCGSRPESSHRMSPRWDRQSLQPALP